MAWLQNLKRAAAPQDATVKEVPCGPDRALPWSEPVRAENHRDRYKCHWEATYLSRMRAHAEIASGFRHYEATWARTLEYGWVARRTAPGDRLLDVGSGVSDFPAILSGMVAEVTATDLQDYSEAHARIQREKGATYRWEKGDARSLPYADGQFDCVTCVSVIEHIPAPGDAEAAREMIRVCRPGGRVLLTVPYSHRQGLEDHEHPAGLQRYYTFQDVLERFVTKDVILRDFNFLTSGMPEDGVPQRFTHPEACSVVALALEKKAPAAR